MTKKLFVVTREHDFDLVVSVLLCSKRSTCRVLWSNTTLGFKLDFPTDQFSCTFWVLSSKNTDGLEFNWNFTPISFCVHFEYYHLKTLIDWNSTATLHQSGFVLSKTFSYCVIGKRNQTKISTLCFSHRSIKLRIEENRTGFGCLLHSKICCSSIQF